MRFPGMAGYHHKFCQNFATYRIASEDLFGRQVARVLLRILSQCCCTLQCLLHPILMHLSICLWMLVTLEWVVSCYRRTSKVLITLCVIIWKSWTVTCVTTLLLKKKTLALLLSLQHFDIYLRPSVAPIQIYMDHNLLVFISKVKNSNQWLLRWSLALQGYNVQIHHAKDKITFWRMPCLEPCDW